MLRFHSPYQTLHRLRAQEARLAEMELGARVAELKSGEDRQAQAEAELEEAARRVVAQRSGTNLAADLLADQQFLALLDGNVATIAGEVLKARQVVETLTVEVIEKRAGVEAVQKLLDRDRQAYRHETLKQQQLAIDEFSTRRVRTVETIPSGSLRGNPS